MAAPAFSWTGFYTAANVGGAWTPNNSSSDFGPLFPPFIVNAPQAVIPTIFPGQLASLTGTGSGSGVIAVRSDTTGRFSNLFWVWKPTWSVQI